MEVLMTKRSELAQRDLFAPFPQKIASSVRAKALEHVRTLLLEAVATATATTTLQSSRDQEASDDEDPA
jgi:hypothetical protein